MCAKPKKESHGPFSEYSTHHPILQCCPFLDVPGLPRPCTDIQPTLENINITRTHVSPCSASTASRTPRRASVWCSRVSMASIYPLGGPRLREGPRNVHAAHVRIRNRNRR